MPGNSCSVAICKNQSRLDKGTGVHRIFFCFPRDPEIRRQWIASCHRKDQFNPDHGRICSDHFTDDDYIECLQARLTGTEPKRLKKNAIPSMKISAKQYYQPSTSQQGSMSRLDTPRDFELETKKRTFFEASVLENKTEQDTTVCTNEIITGSQLVSDGPISPISYTTVYKRKPYNKYVKIDINLLRKVVEALEKMNDECYLFGEFIAHEMRSVRSPRLRMKFKTKVQKEILKITENINKKNNK